MDGALEVDVTEAEGRERRVGEVDDAEGFESEAEGFRRRRRGDTLDAPKPLCSEANQTGRVCDINHVRD